MGTSAGALVPSGWAAPCSVLAVQIFLWNVQIQQSWVAPVHLLLCPCCCSECLFRTPEPRTWSQSATTAPAGFSSAPGPEVHKCSSPHAETALCCSDQVKYSICPHRAAPKSWPYPSSHPAMYCSVSWCAAETALGCTVGFLIWTDALIERFWHSKLTWWGAQERRQTAPNVGKSWGLYTEVMNPHVDKSDSFFRTGSSSNTP